MHSFHSHCDEAHHNYGTDQFLASQFVLSYDNQYMMCVSISVDPCDDP